jgi:hypothetical protein
MKFTLAVETYMPVTDGTTTRKNSNRLTSEGAIGASLSIQEDNNRIGFSFFEPTPNGTYFSGNPLPITWSNTGTLLRVNLYYRFAGTTDDWVLFARSAPNSGSYDWTVPFFSDDNKVVSGDPVRAIVASETGRGARIRAIINASGEVEKIVIFDGGFGYTNLDTIQVSPLIQPPPGAPPFVSPEITADVSNGQVVGYTILNPGSGFTPTPVNYVELKIENDVDDTNYQVYEKIQTFTGDTDPSGADVKKIKNLSPTVAELASFGIDPIGLVTGPGVETGSKITSVDVINNLVNVDRDVTLLITEGEYTLEPKVAIFEIQ